MTTQPGSLTTQVRSASGLNIAVGAWLVIAPFALSYSDATAALWNDIVAGLVILGLAIWSGTVGGRLHGAAPAG